MPNDYSLLFDPALGLSGKEFAEAWSEIPECVAAAQCRSGRAREKSFSLDLGDAATVALITMGAGLAKDLIVELVKRAITRAEEKRSQKAKGEVVVEQVPDSATGLPILRVSRKP